MKKKLFYLILAIFLLAGLNAHYVQAESKYLAAFAGLKGKIDIAGGTAHIPVMKEAAKRIMIYNPNIRITVAVEDLVLVCKKWEKAWWILAIQADQ